MIYFFYMSVSKQDFIVAIWLPSHNFFSAGLDTANQDYCQKLASKETQSKTLFNLGWKVDELSRLNKDGRCLSVEVHKLMELLGEKDCDLVSGNVAKRLSTLSTSLTTFLKGVLQIDI